MESPNPLPSPGPGIVPSDEALEQLLGGEVEGSAEMFFTARTTCSSFRATSPYRPGAGHGVYFGAVGEEIVRRNPRQVLTVG